MNRKIVISKDGIATGEPPGDLGKGAAQECKAKRGFHN